MLEKIPIGVIELAETEWYGNGVKKCWCDHLVWIGESICSSKEL